MAALPVREMVLYKHGVGFFVRGGIISGDAAELNFRQEEINDVLKSLAVFDKSGGQVLGIHYRTPMDKAAQLAGSSINLSSDASLRSLLGDLRGRHAELVFETTPGTSETISGRVIGIDDPPYPNAQHDSETDLNAELVSVLAEDGQVRVFRLGQLRNFRILDGQSARDLSYFLDTSMSEDNRRVVNLRLSEGEHDLLVYYVAPSPTWRVSYRLVAESDENGETGKALIQGWGLFDNRLDEDLDDVQVTLVAGQPISFIYDLYESTIPKRPVVKDAARIAPGPVEFSGAASLEDMDQMRQYSDRESIVSARMSMAADDGSSHFVAQRQMDSRTKLAKAMSETAPAAAQGQDAGAFFQYVVTAPVSVKRGESALVPIISAEAKYQRELLFNDAKVQNHPVVSLRFKNSTGLTFERGPVTVVEDGDYKGEAVVPFTKDGDDIYLPYAVELGVRVKVEFQTKQQSTGLNIKDNTLIYEQFDTKTFTYTIENTTVQPVTVTVEANKLPEWELHDTRQPDAETASEQRWRVEVKERARTTFTTHTRRRNYRYEQIQRLDHRALQEAIKNRWLDDAINQRLGEMLERMGAVQAANEAREQLETERTTLYQRQEQIRANLASLQATGKEASLRERMLKQLETSQDRLEAIDRETSMLTNQIAAAEARVNEIIAGLG